MRYILPLAVLLLAQGGAAWATGDTDRARPGGAFSTQPAESVAACERLCADDTLCMAWSFRAGACELKANVPLAVAQTGTTSGVSLRAPASMRTPPQLAAAARAAAQTEPPPLATSEPAGEDPLAMALLGGPESDQELRSRLGNSGFR